MNEKMSTAAWWHVIASLTEDPGNDSPEYFEKAVSEGWMEAGRVPPSLIPPLDCSNGLQTLGSAMFLLP